MLQTDTPSSPDHSTDSPGDARLAPTGAATLLQTPSQTVGPFFHYGLIFFGENLLVDDAVRGQRIVLTGRILDGDGAPLSDALVEIWHADAEGIYPHPADPRHSAVDPHFRGFGRSDTLHEGQRYRFETVMPGRVPGPSGTLQAPHVCFRIFARGLLLHVTTRMYFADEALANSSDPVLTRVRPSRRGTLLARLVAPVGSIPVYRFDVILQGAGETVFFEP
jgi:protocatechuate 3,4-dioxygenase, alpha subunit